MKLVSVFYLLISLLMSGCSLGNKEISSSEKIALTNNKTAQRIITLTSLTTDIVKKLAPQSLIGIHGSSLFKEDELLTGITKVSEGRNPPNLEKIIELKPDLVIGAKGFHDKTLKSIQSLGIKTISTTIKNWSDLENLFVNLGRLTGGNSSNLKANLPYCFTPSIINEKEVLVLVSLKPLLAPNSTSWAGSMLDRFDLVNLTSTIDSKGPFKGYVNLSEEWLVKENPRNLILIDFNNQDISQFSKLSFWNRLDAVSNNNISILSYYGFINPGSLKSIDNACKALYEI